MEIELPVGVWQNKKPRGKQRNALRKHPVLVFLAFNVIVYKQEMVANFMFKFSASLLTTALHVEPQRCI